MRGDEGASVEKASVLASASNADATRRGRGNTILPDTSGRHVLVATVAAEHLAGRDQLVPPGEPAGAE